MEFIILMLIIVAFAYIHTILKTLRRRQLQDKILEDEQALIEYDRLKMELEKEKLLKEIEELKKNKTDK